MFKQIANIAQLMKQAQAMQGRVYELKAQLEALRLTGSADGLVEVEVSGDQRITAVRISEDARAGKTPELEQLIMTAANQALDRAKQSAAEIMQSATGDMAGFGDMFPQIGSPS